MSEASLTRRDCNRITRDISRRLCPEVSMRLPRLCTPLLFVVALLAGLFAVSSIAAAQSQSNSGAKTTSPSCPNDNSGLKLPAGFCATVFADDIGHARHLVVISCRPVPRIPCWTARYSCCGSIKETHCRHRKCLQSERHPLSAQQGDQRAVRHRTLSDTA